ncbi:isochorismatase family protein [Amycolatopsis acidicola]|uniref:isochorismatase n=1 Tax=Amycolatopsis acidicola TaxID=2596893 RepID=A0A5N0UZ05_9PSEU|nr:isochorismatase family protein [Amycolatopsis acidicola]
MSLPTIAPYPVPTGAELPASTVRWRPEPDRAVLLVHDMQRYFLAAYQADAEPLATVVPNIARLISRARGLGIPVIFSAQPGDQQPADRRLLTELWGPGLKAIPEHEDVIEDLAPQPDDVVLTKWRYSAFQRTDLRERLHGWGRDQLLVTGVYAHIGVLLTACDAFMQDVQPFLVADAVADFSEEEHRLALRYAARRCGSVTETATVLGQLSGGLTPERLRADVLAILETEDEVADDDDLREHGLDSIRIIHLVEQWRALGVDVNFVQLAGVPTIRGWQEGLAAGVA